jgi:hypothetical protein
MKSNIETAEPMRAKARKLIEDPKVANPRTETELPRRVQLNVDMVEPKFAMARKLKLLPKFV